MRIVRTAVVGLAALTFACAQPQRGPVQVAAAATPQQAVKAPATALPNRDDSLKFAVLGDFGDGSSGQLQLAAEMARVHQRFPFELVITVGDNIYGSQRPQDFVRKFEAPYKPLTDAGVKFYASLGNHDSREQRYYKLFNMDGKLYYSFKPDKQNVRFFALESTYLEPEQVAWVAKELEASREDWKIPYFHHPPYSSGGRHGSHMRHREVLEPLFVKFNVSVVFNGHDHIYERIKPQQGIVYFVTGSGGKLRTRRSRRQHRAHRGVQHDRAGVRHLRDQRRRALFQRHFAERPGDRLRGHHAAQIGFARGSGAYVRGSGAYVRGSGALRSRFWGFVCGSGASFEVLVLTFEVPGASFEVLGSYVRGSGGFAPGSGSYARGSWSFDRRSTLVLSSEF